MHGWIGVICMYIFQLTEVYDPQNKGMAVMLDEIINYVHSLQNQVEVNKQILQSKTLTDFLGFFSFLLPKTSVSF